MDSGQFPSLSKDFYSRRFLSSSSEGVYVDLLENPERFTGYAGASSSRVWKAIYEENCFTPVPFIDPSRSTSEGGTGFAPISSTNPFGMPSLSSGSGNSWGESEKRLMGNLAGPRDGGDEICLEKRVFYRVISGLHASISIHICDDYLDQSTGKWVRLSRSSDVHLRADSIVSFLIGSKLAMLRHTYSSTSRKVTKCLLHLRSASESIVKIWTSATTNSTRHC